MQSRKLRIIQLILVILFLPGISFAQQTLDEIDATPWADAVSPLDGAAPVMESIPFRQVKHVNSDRQISLSGTWNLSDGQGISVNASVPCGIHYALMEAGVIPDPRLGRNDTIAEQCSYKEWTLERTFQYDGSMTDPLLSFKGVANKCRVWLNGEMIGEHEGMFGGPDIAVGSFLRKGENTIKVELSRILVLGGGWTKDANESWKNTVVANCVYGWHYCRIPSLGIWNDVLILDRPVNRIENPFIMTRHHNGDMRLGLTIPETTSGEIRLLITPDNFKGQSQAYKASINNAKGNVAFDFHINNPQLWWPNDAGEQHLYRAEVQLVKDGKIVSVCSRRFGVRTIEMKPLPIAEEEQAKCYKWLFCINGRDMFIRGTGWCTMDVMLEFTRERYERFLAVARQQHVQMIRAWGGGMPETDTFYDVCDELGIMVLQEWPTCWDSHFVQPYDLLKETVERNTVRLRNHPSLAMWGGGNESYNLVSPTIDMMGRLSKELDGTRVFHRGEPRGGSRHDYHCWWENAPITYNLRMTAHFWGEFGIPSLPNIETINHYMNGERYEWPPKPESTFTHHTATFGYSEDIENLTQYAGYFMPFTSLEDVILGSQLAQTEGVRHTLERARTMWPETTGALYYKLNDNYPGLSWSSVDYQGAIKPLHYFARRAFAPTTSVLLFDTTNLARQEVILPYYLLNDDTTLNGKQMKAHLTVWNHRMECVYDSTFTLVPKQMVEKIADIKLNATQTTSEMLYLKTDLIGTGNKVIARNWYFSNYETRQGVLLESKASEVVMKKKGNRIIITNLSNHPAVGVTLSAPGYAKIFMPSDNYVWIDPHETITITTNVPQSVAIDWWNRKRF
ncbi:MAG: beta-mannosidase [Bacteroidaceae bacterium]|nr:beta-mannosidase [Bacteroidaceae bacterium]